MGPEAAGDRLPGWLDELPLHDEGPPVRVGTRRVGEADWLVVDEHRASRLALKRRLLAERRDEVVAVAVPGPDTGVAQRQTLDLVIDWLRAYHPGLPISAPPAPPPGGGVRHHRHEAPFLEAAARVVQEDLCLMGVGEGAPRLLAAVVCFPSHWRIGEKVGHPMAAIHAPVPDYEEALGRRPDRVLEGLPADRIVVRRNWAVHDGDDLFVPERPPTAPLGVDEVPDRLWLRSERQTLRRLPTGAHVLFTIGVQQAPVGRLVERPDVATRLAAAVRREAAGRLDRLAEGYVEPLLAWLDGVVAGRDRVRPGCGPVSPPGCVRPGG